MTQKVALVTGASRGIGRAIALELAQRGYDVAINYAGSEDKAKEVAASVEQLGRKAIVVKADVTNESDVKSMVKSVITELGSIDVLVNNAGITRDNLLIRMKEDEFDQVINTNLKGVFLCMKAASRPMMKQRSGKLLIFLQSLVSVVIQVK